MVNERDADFMMCIGYTRVHTSLCTVLRLGMEDLMFHQQDVFTYNLKNPPALTFTLGSHSATCQTLYNRRVRKLLWLYL